jgi:hypothetical protein
MSAIHPFERSGLGKAPFRYVGLVHQEIAYGEAVVGSVGGVLITTHAGGTCDHCGHAILDMFAVESADGKRFKVGCDCIDKVGDVKGTATLPADVKAAKLARENRRIEAAKAALPTAWLLSGQPHPTKWRAQEGATMADYCKWMFEHAGHAGKLATARIVERAMAPRVEE